MFEVCQAACFSHPASRVAQSNRERIAARAFEDDDLAWAKPVADEGLAAIERGEVATSEEYARRMDALVARLPALQAGPKGLRVGS